MARFGLTKFVTGRHFGESSGSHAGSKFPASNTPESVIAHLNVLALDTPLVPSSIPGMEDFCLHLIVPNWTEAKTGVVSIESIDRSLIKSDYVVRAGANGDDRDEPMYLARWIEEGDLGCDRPVAAYLDAVFYSREQLIKEMPAMFADYEHEYGAVSFSLHMSPEESPMSPDTVLRNALGREYGGNGTPFCRVTNDLGADYFNRFILVK